MKVLLDNNVPRKLRRLLLGHDVFTTPFMHWEDLANGDLLRAAATNGFDLLITFDKGIPYEQYLPQLPCAVVVLTVKQNGFAKLFAIVPDLLDLMDTLLPRSLTFFPSPKG